MPGASALGKRRHAVVVVDLAAGALLRREADVEVAVEVARRTTTPSGTASPCAAGSARSRPAARARRPRSVTSRCARCTVMPSMWSAMNEQLGQPCSQPGPEHEVLHQQLAPALEQLGERAPAVGRVEDVVLLDAHPGQRAALAGDLVAAGGSAPSRAPAAPCARRSSARRETTGWCGGGVGFDDSRCSWCAPGRWLTVDSMR